MVWKIRCPHLNVTIFNKHVREITLNSFMTNGIFNSVGFLQNTEQKYYT